MRSTPFCRPRCRRLLFAALALASSPVFAQSTDDTLSPALDRFSIWLGAYYADTSTTLGAGLNRYDVSGHLNLQHDLGFPSHQVVPRVRFDFLLGTSQGFSFDYYQIDQSRTKTLGTSIYFDGNTYDAAASATGRVNFDFGSAAYKWWFGHQSDVFGIGVGAAYYRVHAGISGEASLNGQIIGNASTYTTDSAWAPELQLGWRHAFTNNLRMYVNASGVKKNGSHLGGHIWDAAAGVEWFPWQNIGFGAEYDYTRIKIDQQHHYYSDDLALRMNGPTVFVRLRF
ncbi:autotransporter outer membrane beta-barrel domain-containing protein [Dyella acidiphila]|uniref:autotransporter outer membrane beta-barrel domain-containing protein n=1 Tax=Dyella acidiphila TaxID=2775866 RepID=UPI001CE45BD8|nr:autotransporter outer membrane beta-barrel domain-containing protein [Dyella acidiphila]